MKKTLAILLSLALVICMIPGTAFADPTPTPETAIVTLSAYEGDYTGSAHEKPTVRTITVEGASNIVVGEATVTWDKTGFTDAGTYTATVTGTCTKNDATVNYSGTATYVIKPASIAGATVTLAEGPYTYDGTQKKPVVKSVVIGSDVTAKTLVADKDYTVEYGDNINAGDTAGSVVVKGKGNYDSATSATKAFKIEQFDLSTASVSIANHTSTTLDWTKVKFYVGGVVNNTFLNKDTLTASTPALVSTGGNSYTVKFTALSNNLKNGSEELKGAFLVLADLNDETKYDAKVSGTYTYDGTDKTVTPYFERKSGYSGAVPSTSDFSITDYSGRKNAGTYTVTLEGKGNKFAGRTTATFTIAPRAASNVSIEAIPNQLTGAEPRPVVTDTLGGKKVTLVLGADYSVDYAVTGTNEVTVTLNFDHGTNGNYTGTRTITYKTVDAAYLIEATDVVVNNGIPYNQYYFNAVQKPSIKVNLGAGTTDLREGTDYTVTYKYTDAKGVVQTTTSPKDAHDYTIVVTGKGTYGGEAEITGKFTIAKFPFTSSYVTITVTQGSTTAAPNVTVKSIDGKITFVKGTDYTVGTPYTYNGKSTVVISSTGTGNLAAGSLSETYAVSAKNIAYCTADFAIGSKQTYQYTGSIIKPTVTVRDGYTTLALGTDYTVTYKDAAGKVVYSPKDAGTYTIVIEGKGMYSGTRTLTFYIQGTSIANYTVTLKESVVKATGYAQTPSIVSVKYGYASSLTASDYTVSYQDATGKTVTSISAPGTYKVVVTGKNGYSGSTYATFTIKGLENELDIAKTSFKVYEESDSFKINAKATEGTIIYTSMNPSVATVSATGVVTIHKVGRARIVVETINNKKYDPIEDEVFVKVYPDKAKMTKKPWTDGKKGQMKVRWEYQDGVTKYQVRYSTSKSFSSYKTKTVKAHGKDLTTQSTTIKELKSNKTYYFKVRAVYETYNENGTKITYYGSWSPWRSAKTK